MANVLAPFGFRWARNLTSSAPNAAQTMRRILKTNSSPIYFGDPVSESSGYVVQATAGTSPITGIFVGCKYVSKSIGWTIWNRYWPGNGDAQSDPECYIIDDPDAVFTVQASGGPIALADIQANIQFNLGTATAPPGVSGAYVDATTIATTSTLPFRIIGFPGDGMFPAIGPGSDNTSANNWAFVALNNQVFKTMTAPTA